MVFFVYVKYFDLGKMLLFVWKKVWKVRFINEKYVFKVG